MVALGRLRRGIDDRVEHRPGVRRHGHPVAPDLVPERGHIEAPGHRQRARRRRSRRRCSSSAPTGGTRRDAVHGVGGVSAAEGRAERGLRPPAIRDPTRLVCSPSPLNRMNARSAARPGFGRYHRGSVTANGSICSMSVARAIPRSRGAPPPPSTNTSTPSSSVAIWARSGSATIRSTCPSDTSRCGSPSGASGPRPRRSG